MKFLKQIRDEFLSYITGMITLALRSITQWTGTASTVVTDYIKDPKKLIAYGSVVLILIDVFTKGKIGVIGFGVGVIKDMMTFLGTVGTPTLVVCGLLIVMFLFRDKK